LDLLATMQELHAKNVDLYLHQQGLDTSTPSGRAMFGMMGVFAESERAMIQERVKAGFGARQRRGRYKLGRPTLEDSDPDRAAKGVWAMRAQGVGARKIAKQLGVGVGTVLRQAPSEIYGSRAVLAGLDPNCVKTPQGTSGCSKSAVRRGFHTAMPAESEWRAPKSGRPATANSRLLPVPEVGTISPVLDPSSKKYGPHQLVVEHDLGRQHILVLQNLRQDDATVDQRIGHVG
jgi:hypothetical protein